MVERLGELRKGRRERIEKGSRERIEIERKERKGKREEEEEHHHLPLPQGTMDMSFRLDSVVKCSSSED